MDNEAVSVTPTSTLVVELVNSKHFRVVFADEVGIGLSPAGMINLDFANDRESPPRRVTYTYDATGKLAGTERQYDVDMVRELEVSVMISRSTAMQLRDELSSMLDDDESEIEIEPASSDISNPNVVQE